MSLKSTFEHNLHIESFRNIDLLTQGLYYLRFYLTHEHNGKIDYSLPYNYLEGKKVVKNNKGVPSADKNLWAPPQILDDLSAFQTKTFMIRYQEEEVELNEIVFFKIDIPAYPEYDNHVFILYCELMCADIQKIGGGQQSDDFQLFKCLSIYQSKIRNSHKGIHEFMPVMFDSHNFCVVNCTFHSSLSNLKFALSDIQVQLSRQNTLERNKNVPVMIQPKTFLEFLNRATHRFNRQNSQKFFDYYVGQMRASCEAISSFIAGFIKAMKIPSSFFPQVPQHSFQELLEQHQYLSDTKYQKSRDIPITQLLDLKKPSDQQQFSQFIEKDFNTFASLLFQLNNQLVQIISDNPKQLRIYLQGDYLAKVKDRWGETYFRQIIKTDQYHSSSSSTSNNQLIATEIRRKLQLQNDSLIDIEDMDLFPPYAQRIVMFEEVFQMASKSLCHLKRDQPQILLHIIVLCHGFQGNSYDLRLVKDNLSLLYPEALYLCSRSNEDQTDGNIADMGKNLAIEVTSLINEQSVPFKISFIGHSLGGIIIRASLPHLSKYKDMMFSYISLSSPHLGYMYNSSTLIDAGLWILKRMRKSLCLQQLSMSDNPNIEETFLYRLAKENGLNWFQNIVFVSSTQDNYVPFESARVMRCEEANQDPMYYKMFLIYIVQKGEKVQLNDRLTIQFIKGLVIDQNRCQFRIGGNVQQYQYQQFIIYISTINNIIGRTAHIQFLENNSFLKTFVCCQSQLFI